MRNRCRVGSDQKRSSLFVGGRKSLRGHSKTTTKWGSSRSWKNRVDAPGWETRQDSHYSIYNDYLKGSQLDGHA